MQVTVPDSVRLARLSGLTLGVCFLLAAVSRGTTDSYAVFLLPLSDAFAWDRASAASVYSVFLLSYGLSAPFVGRVFDRWGPARVYLLGLLILGGGTFAAGWLDSLWQFQLCLGVLGGMAGSAIGAVPHAALLSRWYPGRLTSAIAVVQAASGVGVLVLSPASQLLIDAYGWRDAYHVIGLGVLAMSALLLFLPWDAIAAGRPATLTPGSFGAGGGVRLREALRSRPFWALFTVHFLTANGMFAISPQIVAFLIESGFAPMTAASAFGAAGIAATGGLLTFGWIADRVGRLVSITLSYAMTLGGFLLLAALGAHPSEWLLFLFVAVYGPSFGSRGPIISAMVASIFGRGRNLGTIMGAVQVGMGLGAASGATIGGVLHDVSGYDWVIAFAFIAASIPLVLFWTVPELKRQ